jgi:PAS domain S-box-containing protein
MIVLNLAPVLKNRRKSDQVKKRKPPWILGGFVMLLLTLLFVLQSSNLWKSLTIDSASETLLLYALSSLNFIALVIFAAILSRSLLKLRQERRALKIGSKIKTRLLVYFVAVNLLPLIAMAVFSYLFMNRALERWFSQIPEKVIREAGDLQHQTAKDQLLRLKQTTAMLAKSLDKQAISNNDLQNLARLGSFTRLEVISADSATIAFAQNGINESKKVELEKVVGLIRNRQWDSPELQDGKGFDAAIADLSSGNRFVTISDMSSTENMSQIAREALFDMDQLKSQQVFVRQLGLSTLGLLTFLLIFASSWTAFHVAKGLTRPIRALAEGADQITRGNLGYRVNVTAEDELDLLVIAFNEMSGRLDENEEEITERRKYTETVLQSLSTGVISFDHQNRVTTINRAAIRMFNLENADFTNIGLKQLVNEENHSVLERLVSRAKRIGQAAEQTKLLRENTDDSLEKGGDLPVALTATALPNENGTVLVIEDLSELIAAQRASAWREVARRMAHEIKNPLTPIQLSAERIAKRFRPQFDDNGSNGDEENISAELPTDQQAIQRDGIKNLSIIKDGTETILREVSSLKTMVDEFSKFARLPNMKLETGNLNEVIRQTSLLYSDRISDIEIEIQLDETLPDTMIDEEQLKRVFVNLIDNAVEAFEETQEKKTIVIKTYFDAARDLIVAEVTDNGIGIRPRDFQRLFQPYFSTKGRGTGLGLAIVQRIITEHGGKIRGVSKSQKGAKFIMEIPASK